MLTEEQIWWGNRDDRVRNSMVRKPFVLGLEIERKRKELGYSNRGNEMQWKGHILGTKAGSSVGCDP